MESVFPGQVADGVSRLTVLNVGSLLGALNLDKNCGFANQALMEQAARNPISTDNSPSGIFDYNVGEIELTTKDCVLNFPEPKVISEDCQGATTIVQGKVTVTATQRRYGVLTGVDYEPVIPQSDTPISYEIQKAHFENFSAYFSTDPEQKMTFKNATLKASAKIHLAKDYRTQLCSEPVPNLTFTSIDFLNDKNSPAIAELPGPFGLFETEIAFAHLYDIQVGESFDLASGTTTENKINGFLQVWNSAVNIPSDGLGLEPEYNRQAFRDSYICREKGLDPEEDPPLQFDCNMDKFLFENTARLLTQNIGGVLKLDSLKTTPDGISADCGFQSTKYFEGNTRTQVEGQEKFSILMPTCNISEKSVSTGTLLSRNSCEERTDIEKRYTKECISNCKKNCSTTEESRCHKNCANQFEAQSEYVSGGVSSSGTLIVDGNINSFSPGVTRTFPSPFNPVANLSNINFNAFSFYSKLETDNSAPPIQLTLFGGNTSAKIQPISTTVQDSDEPCEFKLVTPVVQFENINFKETEVDTDGNTNGFNSELTINIPPPNKITDKGCDLGPIDTSIYGKTALKFEYNINSADFSAANGYYLGVGNYVNGNIKINENKYKLDNIKLDPRYNQELFDLDYATCPNEEGEIANPIPANTDTAKICEET